MAPFVMLALRRVAVRALPLPSTSIAARLRPITTLTSSITRLGKQPQSFSPLQKRFASEEAPQTDQEDSSSIVNDLQSATGPDSTEPRTVFVGNLFFHLQEDDLKKTFEKVGAVQSVRIITGPGGQSRGFGYIEFEDSAGANAAVEEFHLKNLEGRQMNVQLQKPRFQSAPKYPLQMAEPSKTLFIGNMPFDMSDRDLNNLFAKIKNLVDVRVAIDRRTGQPRGFAHADFVDVESAQQGMAALKDLEVSGRTLRVDFSSSTRGTNPRGPSDAPPS